MQIKTAFFRDIVALFLLVVCINCTVFSQTKSIDSLLFELKTAKSDTKKISVLRSLSEFYTSTDPDKKCFYAKQYLEIAENNNIDSIIPIAYCDIAMTFGIKAQYDSTMYYFSKGLKFAKEKNIESQVARAYIGIGFTFDRLDNPKAAVENYKLALKILKRIKHKKGLNQVYINLGSLYFDLGEYKIAESYFTVVLKNHEAANDQEGKAYSYFNLGNTNRLLNRDDESYYYYSKSLKIREKLQDLNGIALANWGLGELFLKQGKFNEALRVLEIALKNNRITQNKYQEIIVLITTAQTYFELKNFNKSKETAQLALQTSKLIKSKGVGITALNLLIAISKESRNFEKAFEYQSEATVLSDSLKLEKAKNDFIYADFQRIRTENDTLEKSNGIILSKNLTYKKAIFIISVLFLIVVILLYLYFRKSRQKNKINKILKEQKEEIITINSALANLNKELLEKNELTTLQKEELEHINNVKNQFFSIVSHDLRSPISTLKMLFNLYLDGDLSQAEMNMLLKELEKTVFNTADFLDNLLEWSKSQLEGMVINSEHFTVSPIVEDNLEILRPKILEKNIFVQNTIDKNAIIFADKNMMNVLFRNIISNSIKFCNNGDSIVLTSTTNDDYILISIKDTGIGITSEDQNKIFKLEHAISQGTSGEKGHHIGLVLCKDLVEQNNGAIWFESSVGHGTTFFIKLPRN